MFKVSFMQKPYKKAMIEAFGARCIASPSNETEIIKKVLQENSNSTGSLGIAISEAVERCASNSNIKYALGSVLNHVLLHQTIVEQEAMKQMESLEKYPDIVIVCTVGGSNFSRIALPYLGDAINSDKKINLIAIEPSACPFLTKGKYTYDFRILA